MSRSVELGRAVLDMPTINHELWLTTLITILPEQNATYLAQLTPGKCLEFLSSGVPWVHRGSGMHLDLRLTLHNEAMPYAQLQDLTNAVLRAPIWNQLMLRPSLPANDMTDPGTVRFNIGHAVIDGRETEQKRHRLFSNVPASDVRPPDRVASVALQSVHLYMDILKSTPPRRLILRRSNPSPNTQEASKSEAEDTTMNLFDPASRGGLLCCNESRPAALISGRKRKRPVTGMLPDHPQLSNRTLTQTDIRTMIENALCLSIRGTITKTHNVCKIKASTFRSGLADIAPALWRCGYLDVLSHRAQLMPTITQSLVQTSLLKAMSVSLKSKIESIDIVARMGRQEKEYEPEHETESSTALNRLSIAAQLWNHSQRILLRDPVPPTQACVASDPDEVNLDSDCMLAEEQNEWVDDVYRVNDEDIILSHLSETINRGCMLPATPPIATSDNCTGRVHQQPSLHPILESNLLQSDEDLLFDSPLRGVTPSSDTP